MEVDFAKSKLMLSSYVAFDDLYESDSKFTMLIIGSTTDDTDCIVLGKISTWNHLHALLLHIGDAGRRAVENLKVGLIYSLT